MSALLFMQLSSHMGSHNKAHRRLVWRLPATCTSKITPGDATQLVKIKRDSTDRVGKGQATECVMAEPRCKNRKTLFCRTFCAIS